MTTKFHPGIKFIVFSLLLLIICWWLFINTFEKKSTIINSKKCWLVHKQYPLILIIDHSAVALLTIPQLPLMTWTLSRLAICIYPFKFAKTFSSAYFSHSFVLCVCTFFLIKRLIKPDYYFYFKIVNVASLTCFPPFCLYPCCTHCTPASSRWFFSPSVMMPSDTYMHWFLQVNHWIYSHHEVVSEQWLVYVCLKPSTRFCPTPVDPCFLLSTSW